MKIAFLTPFYPLRGGISQFSGELAKEIKTSNELSIINYKRQYPSFLFPGTSQFVEEQKGTSISEGLDSINPISYFTSAKKINKLEVDLFISAYWMSFFSPCIGTVARMLRKNIKRIGLIHNLIPHEPKAFDKLLATYYLKSHDAFVVMSESVKNDILTILPNASVLVLFHPLYNQFGEKLNRQVACEKLEISSSNKNLLFFGLIRDYKGLDVLLKTVSMLSDDYFLIIAGECYGSFDKYDSIIREYGIAHRVKIVQKFIPDSEVSSYFSAVDMVVLPYKTATQSGVTAVAHHFELPVIATNVGGLKESISPMENGIITESNTSESLAESIQKGFVEETNALLKQGVLRINKERDWKSFTAKLIEFCELIKRK